MIEGVVSRNKSIAGKGEKVETIVGKTENNVGKEKMRSSAISSLPTMF